MQILRPFRQMFGLSNQLLDLGLEERHLRNITAAKEKILEMDRQFDLGSIWQTLKQTKLDYLFYNRQ